MIVVAAGQGVRAGAGEPKQFRTIAGVPMLLRALRPFTSHPDVRQTVVVLPAADAAAPPAWLAPLLGDALVVVAGGAERGDSVANGLAALGPDCTTVLVHDAARPFVDTETVSAVIAATRDDAVGGAIAAVAVGDTLKEAAPDDALRVARTVPRDGLWRAQTPQGFRRAVLTEAHRRARAEGAAATDDAALVERLGLVVRLVPDSPRNFKVTTPGDFALAELVAAGS